MDRKADLPTKSVPVRNPSRPINPDSTSSSSSSLSSPPQDFIRNVRAAFKRYRPLGVMQSNSLGPRRSVVPQRKVGLTSSVGPVGDDMNHQDTGQGDCRVDESITRIKNAANAVKESQEDSITLPSISGTITKAFDFEQRDQIKPLADGKDNNPKPHIVDSHKKVQFSVASKAVSQGADNRMASGSENLSSHMSSLALTEMDWVTSNQGEASTVINNEAKHQNVHSMEIDVTSRSDAGGSSLLAKRTSAVQDRLHQFRNFLSQPNTHSSVAGPSCATTTSVHSTSAPMLNQTTFCPHMHSYSHIDAQPITAGKVTVGKSCLNDQISTAANTSSSAVDAQMPVKECQNSKKESGVSREASLPDGKRSADEGNFQSLPPPSKSLLSEVKTEPSRSDKQDKITSGKGPSAPRKRSHDPDMFYKVNGKLYQRLGKIGSGGSSEVHKVISSDCTIYALKKIKLKGRDYATAYGFCQEIEYLNRLKGKHNIIQLVDYEVTDRALLQEVLNGSMNNKDGRVKDDGYIYMVLEYGEIDLAHMLSQKWKELDGSNKTIDENWLRFYWQQILLAVNTIHEERIVHSDLKPANFLLVKGSLKLIDFGIAKAIMSDTTNIQRDSQVGTLSYMSPEAFLCNESDADGNPIKCGRPSDIWSLGCILYQMVYGRTPFADYKTFWAKFKVITDPNHEISYEQLANPWLLDIMKKCLLWDRSARWRIPELLHHPFLVPPTAPHWASSQAQTCRLLQLVLGNCGSNSEALSLCSQLQRHLAEPDTLVASELLTSRRQQRDLLSSVSKLCSQLEEQLAESEKE